VSLGEVADMGDGVLCLTLARRYVDDRDRRHGMTPMEVGIPCSQSTVDTYMLRRQIPPLPPLPTFDDSMFFIKHSSDAHEDKI
jgi:hypothetical protein